MTNTPNKNANVVRPALSGTLDNDKLADSFRKLESDICDLVRAAQLADLMVAELEGSNSTAIMRELTEFAVSNCEKAAIALKCRYYEEWKSAER
jgi:hypothetical protein